MYSQKQFNKTVNGILEDIIKDNSNHELLQRYYRLADKYKTLKFKQGITDKEYVKDCFDILYSKHYLQNLQADVVEDAYHELQPSIIVSLNGISKHVEVTKEIRDHVRDMVYNYVCRKFIEEEAKILLSRCVSHSISTSNFSDHYTVTQSISMQNLAKVPRSIDERMLKFYPNAVVDSFIDLPQLIVC